MTVSRWRLTRTIGDLRRLVSNAAIPDGLSNESWLWHSAWNFAKNNSHLDTPASEWQLFPAHPTYSPVCRHFVQEALSFHAPFHLRTHSDSVYAVYPPEYNIRGRSLIIQYEFFASRDFCFVPSRPCDETLNKLIFLVRHASVGLVLFSPSKCRTLGCCEK